MTTAPLQEPPKITVAHAELQSYIYEVQALRRLYEAERVLHETLREEMSEAKEFLKQVDKDLYRGNGEPSFRQQIRDLAKKLDDFIAMSAKEREKREAIEAEEKRKSEDWKSRLFWEVAKVIIPVVLFYIANVISKGSP